MSRGVMKMKNFVMNALSYNERARIFYSESTGILKELDRTLIFPQEIKRAYLEFVTVMGVMTGAVGEDERLSIKMAGNHPNQRMFGSLDANGEMRGFIEKGFPLRAVDRSIFGRTSFITVQRSAAQYSGYTGIVEMLYTSIARNLEHYYRKSEQLPTIIRLFLCFDGHQRVALSRAVMVQLLPGESKSILADISSGIKCYEKAFYDPHTKISTELWEQIARCDFRVMSEKPIAYRCNCSKDSFYSVVFSLSPKDIDEIVSNGQSLEAECSLCGKQYTFPVQEISQLFGVPGAGS